MDKVLKRKRLFRICILLIIFFGILVSIFRYVHHKYYVVSDSMYQNFRGLSLEHVNRTNQKSDLSDFFNENQTDSGSYEIRKDVLIIRDNFPGMILFNPSKNVFCLQIDSQYSSRITFFGPMKGKPVEVLIMYRPKYYAYDKKSNRWKFKKKEHIKFNINIIERILFD